MKKVLVTFCVIAMALTMTVSATAGDKTLFGSQEKYDRAEASLLMGLQSENEGLRAGAAYMLGELKSDKAVVPLMAILKCDNCQTARVVAALALCRIGDARGSYAVKQAVQFDTDALVQHRCAWFYNEYVQAGTFAFRSEDGTTSIDLAIR